MVEFTINYELLEEHRRNAEKIISERNTTGNISFGNTGLWWIPAPLGQSLSDNYTEYLEKELIRVKAENDNNKEIIRSLEKVIDDIQSKLRVCEIELELDNEVIDNLCDGCTAKAFDLLDEYDNEDPQWTEEEIKEITNLPIDYDEDCEDCAGCDETNFHYSTYTIITEEYDTDGKLTKKTQKEYC